MIVVTFSIDSPFPVDILNVCHGTPLIIILIDIMHIIHAYLYATNHVSRSRI